jgi:hypothetical protein
MQAKTLRLNLQPLDQRGLTLFSDVIYVISLQPM